MPIHDWTTVRAGIFHAFHELWIASLCNQLNSGCLPSGYFALPDQILGGPEPDLITLQSSTKRKTKKKKTGTTTMIETPPQTRIVQHAEPERYARKANRITINLDQNRVIAVIEIVSPGNKASRRELRLFVEKMTLLLERGIHLLVIDLFPPSLRDPQGIHKAIWDEINDEFFELPSDMPLTLASYSAGAVKTAYVEPVAVGAKLPDMPLFLEPDKHIATPLEASYQWTWNHLPEEMKELLV